MNYVQITWIILSIKSVWQQIRYNLKQVFFVHLSNFKKKKLISQANVKSPDQPTNVCFYHEKLLNEEYLDELIDKKLQEREMSLKRKLTEKKSFVSSYSLVKKKIKKNLRKCPRKNCDGMGNIRNPNAKSHYSTESCPNSNIQIKVMPECMESSLIVSLEVQNSITQSCR